MQNPNNRIQDLTHDYLAVLLADFMRDRINMEAINYTGRKIISSVRDFDDLDLHEKDYPALKVFKTSEEVYYYEKFFKANYAIRYELLLPEMNDLVGLLNWVSQIISKYLFSTLTDKSWLELFVLESQSPGQVNYTVTNGQTGEELKILDYNIRINYTFATFHKLLNNTN